MLRLILIVSGILLAKSSQAQEWFPLGASWYYSQVILLEGETFRYFEVVDEITIQGKNCKVISGACSCAVTGFGNYLYEEDDRVFSYDFEADTFRLLYDFNLLAGDTLVLKGDPILGGEGLFRIDSVTVMQIDTMHLRVQHITPISFYYDFGIKIIERIGSYGCLYPQVAVCDPSTGGLRCYEDAYTGLINFQHPERPCNYITSAIAPLDEQNLSIFPNPTTGSIQIQTDQSIEKIELFNSVSTLCYQISHVDFSNFEINMESFPAGIYFLRISTSTKSVLVKRIVLQ